MNDPRTVTHGHEKKCWFESFRVMSWIVLLMVVAVGCGKGHAYLSPQEPIPADTLITLERSTCYGTCASYILTVSADGTVTFQGREYVKTKGVVKANIPPEKLRQMIALFDDAKYFSLKDRYVTEEDGCPEVWTDNPTAITSIRINGKSKSVAHYYGCQGGGGKFTYPRGLTTLANKIDEIAGTERWIK